MNDKEKRFVQSIQNKITRYIIPVTLKQAVRNASGIVLETSYANKKSEIVDSGIENFLMSKSFAYWIDNYAMVDIPNKGTGKFTPYYYQLEMAKEIGNYRKIVIDKTRQCLTENNFIKTIDRGMVSIKDVKIGDLVETVDEANQYPYYTKVLDSFENGYKETIEIHTELGRHLFCTFDHKVFTRKHGWKEAGLLCVNEDEIASYNSFDKVISIEEKSTEKVYDLTTESHSFLANGLLVHNCGMSTVFSLYCLWRLLSKPSENIDVISLTQAKAQEFVKKFKTTIQIQPKFFMKEIVENNKQKMRFKHPNGEISTITSESQTESAGRSDSLSLLVLDELAFYRSDNMVQSIISAAIPTLTKTGGSIVMISTPNGTAGAGSYYYNQVQEAKMYLDEDTKYLQIGWWEIPDDNEIRGVKRGFNDKLKQAISEDYYHNQVIRKKWDDFFDPIGKNPNDNPFLKSQYSSLGEFKYKQEILHEFIISGDRVFTPDVMEKIRAEIREPIEKNFLCLNGEKVKEMKNFWIWRHPTPDKKYIVSCDPSSGTSNDRSSIQVVDINNLEQCAEFYGFATTTHLPRMIKDIARVYNDAYVVIEANSIGDGVFNALYYDQNDPYTNVFKQRKTSNGITRFTGWITDVKTRKLITSEVLDWFTSPEMFANKKMYSERMYMEFETWIIDAKGKLIHANSCHDDDIMAFGLALYNRAKAAQSSNSFGGFVDEDGNVIQYDRKAYEDNLRKKEEGLKDGEIVFSASQKDDSLSGIMSDGRRKLNLNDTNYAGMYGNDQSFASGKYAATNREMQERLGVDADVYSWLLS